MCVRDGRAAEYRIEPKGDVGDNTPHMTAAKCFCGAQAWKRRGVEGPGRQGDVPIAVSTSIPPSVAMFPR